MNRACNGMHTCRHEWRIAVGEFAKRRLAHVSGGTAVAILFMLCPTPGGAQVPQDHPFRARFDAVPRMNARIDVIRPESGVSLDMVSAVAAGQDGTIYVLHRPATGDPVVVLDRNGRVLRSWGEGLFSTPHGIRLDPAGNVWTVDASSSKVLKFTPQGEQLLEVQLDRPNERDFCGATDVAFGPDGHVFIADGYCNARIVEIDSRGEELHEWGSAGSGPGQFHLPHAIAYGPDGLLYVADRENGRIQRFDPSGQFIDSWEYAGQLVGLAFTPDRRLYIALSLGGGPVDMHVIEVRPETGEMVARHEAIAHELAVSNDGFLLPASGGGAVVLLSVDNK